ncbi:MAG: UDP-N-acetylglucosamine 2-epimerase (non-hydrolyzing) [Gammaproteobacteria bacterium]|nr:UDP-N-acetylglucosamine 2-epimerase (non-hydrolyzing) [Gammaproteobacteria bacterium]
MSHPRLRVVLVAGARPNFMKVAPILRALKAREERFEWRLVHTGQHYDHGMSDVFFEELGIPTPDFHMGAGGGSHAEQTARIMVAFESWCEEFAPDLVMVVGDVNSTLACSIVAKKLGIRVAHVEAGLRSGDRRMPEEINRLVTDAISDLCFVTEPSGLENLRREGRSEQSSHFVGHVMIDDLFFQLSQLQRMTRENFATAPLKQSLGRYGVVTLHRPSNVDHAETLSGIASALGEIAAELPLVFPLHPRTRANLARFNLVLPDRITITEPLPYMEFLNLWSDAALILTDSGGLQEESTALSVPCLTLRENTERPVTLTEGTNVLVGVDPQRIVEAARRQLGRTRQGALTWPALWDGAASERIVAVLAGERAS